MVLGRVKLVETRKERNKIKRMGGVGSKAAVVVAITHAYKGQSIPPYALCHQEVQCMNIKRISKWPNLQYQWKLYEKKGEGKMKRKNEGHSVAVAGEKRLTAYMIRWEREFLRMMTGTPQVPQSTIEIIKQ